MMQLRRRQREIADLETALEQALAGHGRLVMLAGQPGIGKTRTARELAETADQRGARVLWGWCYEGEGAPPYWPWVQPIRAYVNQSEPEQLRSEMGAGASDISGIVPEIRTKLPDLEPVPSLEPEQARFRLFDSIATFLNRASEHAPIEDEETLDSSHEVLKLPSKREALYPLFNPVPSFMEYYFTPVGY